MKIKTFILGTVATLLAWTGYMIQDQTYVRNMLPGLHVGQTYELVARASSPKHNRNEVIIKPTAYKKTVGRKIPLLKEHIWRLDSIIGVVDKLDIKEDGLYIHATMTINEDNYELQRKIVEGQAHLLSVGFLGEPSNPKTPVPGTGYYQRELPLVFEEADLVEVSVVAVPADNDCKIFKVTKTDWGLWSKLKEFLDI